MNPQESDTAAPQIIEESAPSIRPRWTAPAITSFAPVADAQATGINPGDDLGGGNFNLS